MVRISDIIRAEFGEGDDRRDAGLTIPENIQRYDNILYGKESEMQVLDVYRPKDKTGKLPVIVSVHGGGWVYGDKDRYQYYCMDLAGRGFTVVNFSYRLAPEYKFPASLEDTNKVFTWVLEQGEKFGLDTEQIFAVGDSAGAHILSLYLDICTNPEYASNYKFNIPADLHICKIALNCGQYHMGEKEMDDLTVKLMEEYLPGKGTPQELELLCADNYITEKFPPTYIMTAEEDFLRRQAPLLYRKLQEKNVPCELHEYRSDTEEKLQHVFHLNIRAEKAKQCNDDECNFFRKIIEEQISKQNLTETKTGEERE